MKLRDFRLFGSRHAIPLQLVAVLVALVDVLIDVIWKLYVMNKLDDHNQLVHLGPLGWGGWLLLFGSLTSALVLWLLLKLLDVDLNDRNVEYQDRKDAQ